MDHKSYLPFPIPGRALPPAQTEQPEPPAAPRPAAASAALPEYGLFAEIEIDTSKNTNFAAPAPVPPSATPVMDEKRALFSAMRQIGRGDVYQADRPRTFYKQALLTKDFEDDYEHQAPFSSYFPYYQIMDSGQLRTYFTWRARVRRGDVANVPVSYAFLYMYELLNNVGVEHPRDGLDRLLAFWQAFRVHDAVIDRYALHWLKDYHVFYPLEQPFREFAAGRGLSGHYPSVFVYGSGPEDSFDIFAGVSKYDIRKSVFFGDETAGMTRGCFHHILERLRELFAAKKRCFEDMIFHPISKESAWTPFGSALFHPALRQPDRQAVISPREVYTCRNNRWTYATVMLTDRGKRLVGYIMKEMEACLRRTVKYKYKLSADPAACGGETLRRFESMGLPLPKLIRDSVAEYHKLSTRKVVSVDIGNLAQIRKEALTTQERLIVPEAPDTDVFDPADEPDDVMAAPPAMDGWEGFGDALTRTETGALRVILSGRDIRGFAATAGVMLEVLIDGINQKAMDFIGDAVVELDDTAAVYDDYRQKLMEVTEE